MQFVNLGLRLGLLVYAGYLINALYLTQLPTVAGRAALVAFLFAYVVLFYRRENAAIKLLVLLVPLAAGFPRMVGSPLAPFHVLFTSAFVFAAAATPLILTVRQMAVEGTLSPSRSTLDDSLVPAGTRLEAAFTLLAWFWIGICLLSFGFVSLRYFNLYPFSGDPLYNYVITRAGHTAGEAVGYSRWILASYVNSALFFLYIRQTQDRDDSSLPTLIKWLLVSCSCVAIVAYLQSRFDLVFLNALGVWPATHRLNATFDDPNALATALIMIFPMSILAVIYLTGAARLLAVLTCGGCLYLLYVAASRTAFAGFVVALILIAVALGFRALSRRRYALLAVFTLVGFAFAVAAVTVLERAPRNILIVGRVGPIWDQLKKNWGEGDLSSHISSVASWRDLWWPSAIRMFKENLSSGVGIGVFQYETVNHGAPLDSAGNQYLQMMAEFGVWGLLLSVAVGVLSFYCLAALLSRNSRASLRDYSLVAALSVALLAFAVSLLFGTHLIFPQVSFVFALVLGGLLQLYTRHAEKKRLPRSWRWVSVPLGVGILFLFGQLASLRHSPPLEFRKVEIGHEQDIFGYPPEKWGGQFQFRWLTKVNCRRMTVNRPELRFALLAPHPDVEKTGVTVAFYLDERPIAEIRLRDRQWHTHSVALPSEMLGKEPVLKVTVDRTFQSPGDQRELGVAYREL